MPLNFGFEACSAARSGFELAGMGGGAPLLCEPGIVPGKAGATSVALFMPQDSADCLGLGGGAGSTREGGGGGSARTGRDGNSIALRGSCATDCCRIGKLGGGTYCRTVGGGGGGGVVSLPIGSIFGVDIVRLAGLNPAYFLSCTSLSSAVLFGGRAGNAEGSYSGALTALLGSP